MSTYSRFEDLPVWQEAIRLAEGCEDFIEAAKSSITWSKRDQLDRASLSVFNNIAEGFERGTTKELLAFLYIVSGQKLSKSFIHGHPGFILTCERMSILARICLHMP